MTDLEQRLTQLGRELDWPETPDLDRVRALRRRPTAPRRSPPAAARRRPTCAGGRSRSPSWRCSSSRAACSPRSRACATRCSSSSASRAPRWSGATRSRRRRSCAAPARKAHDARARAQRARLRRRSCRARPAGPDGVFVDRPPGGELSLDLPAAPGMPSAAARAWGCSSTSSAATSPRSTRQDRGPGHEHRAASARRQARHLDLGCAALLLLPPARMLRRAALRIAQNVLLLEHGTSARPAGGRLRPRAGDRAGALARRALAAAVSRRLTGPAYHRPANRSATAVATITDGGRLVDDVGDSVTAPVIAQASSVSPAIASSVAAKTMRCLSCCRNSMRWCAVGAIRHAEEAVAHRSVTK